MFGRLSILLTDERGCLGCKRFQKRRCQTGGQAGSGRSSMNARMFAARVALPVLAAVAVSAQARAADFEWKKFQGKTVTFLANNNPLALALVTYKADFEKLTGMNLKVDGYQEQQMRQRLVTVMNAHSDEVDVFMTLPSREGEQFAAAGWYADLSPLTNEHRRTHSLLPHGHSEKMRRRSAQDH